MKAIVLLGPPGAGKGTMAEGLVNSGYTHVSTGHMLREAIRQGSPVGLIAKGFMDRGELVPDDVVIGIIKELLGGAKTGQKFMFDGFPRTIVQAEKLDHLFAELNGNLTDVILLDCPDEVIVTRLTGRRVCRSCGAVYHINFKPPVDDGICDLDQSGLYQREDDAEQTVRNRLLIYAEQTAPLIEYYAAKGVLYRVDATGSIQDCLSSVLAKVV